MKKPWTIIVLLFLAYNASAEERIFVGIYTEGFEWSYFIECGDGELLWVDDSSVIQKFKRQLKSEGIEFSYDLDKYSPSVYVKFSGRLSEPGKWGHLGQYKHKLIITKYIEHGPPVESECKI